MGKVKRGYNWQARQNKDVVVDNSQHSKIEVDEELLQDGISSEDLILPSKKRKTTKVKEAAPAKKPLSKKERRKLQSVIDRKSKKEKRAGLLEALSQVQASDKELKLMMSTQDMQNKTWKKKKQIISNDEVSGQSVKVVKGANKGLSQQSERFRTISSSSSDCEITSEEEDESEQEQTEEAMENEVERSEEDIAAKHGQEQVATTTADETAQAAVNTEKEAVIKPKPSAKTDSLLNNLKERVAVQRDEQIQAVRLKLPILGEEQQIIEAISENMVTIICGETGSGKTTQVPQFLYEAGYTSGGYLIGITEPRRVAAISMSKRVAEELNLSEEEVSFQIRYEGNTTAKTCIKFMTDGVLLKEVQKDFLLERYRAIIIDEAHERSVFTDVLIGLLSRIVKLRHKKGNPLKLIIMSATLRIEDFRDNEQLFPSPPPVLKIDARQYPVTIHFNKRTPDDYLTEAYKKICKIHRQLPGGGILVFVTGKQEVHTLCKKLQRTFPSRPSISSTEETESTEDRDESEKKKEENEQSGLTAAEEKDTDALDQLPAIELDNYSALPSDEQAELEPDDSDLEFDDDEDSEISDADIDSQEVANSQMLTAEQRKADEKLPLHVLPLYSLLNTKKQSRVFAPPPEGCRLCVISTNVAETSLTIPNIKYVIDTGKTKNRYYDKVTGVSTFRVTFTSQASANQRAGRAGRTGPGHCYRLYSSSVYKDEFEKFSPPEIVSRPVDDLVLQMKALGIERVINFPFPTPPSEESLKAAQDLLVKLGALNVKNDKRYTNAEGPRTEITKVGNVMSLFPLAPRYAKILSLAHQEGLLQYVIAIVAACSVQELFMEGGLTTDMETAQSTQIAENLARQKLIWAGKGESQLLGDAMVYLKAVGAAEFSGGTPQFCEQNGLRFKAISEVRKLRVQLTNIVNSVLPHAHISVDPKMKPPTQAQTKMLRQIMLAGLGDHVAKLNTVPNDAEADVKKKLRNSYQTTLIDDYCYIHPTSVLYKKNVEYVIYQDIEESNDKVYLKGITAVEPEWLARYSAARCTFSQPLDTPEPYYHVSSGQIKCYVNATFGPHSWPLPKSEINYPKKVERYRWFAKAFLEGQVFKKMNKFSSNYLASPSIMVKSWARLQPRTESLLKALYSKSIADRNSLMDVWKQDRTYLLKEVLEWLPESTHDDVRSKWPPVKAKQLPSDDSD